MYDPRFATCRPGCTYPEGNLADSKYIDYKVKIHYQARKTLIVSWSMKVP